MSVYLLLMIFGLRNNANSLHNVTVVLNILDLMLYEDILSDINEISQILGIF